MYPYLSPLRAPGHQLHVGVAGFAGRLHWAVLAPDGAWQAPAVQPDGSQEPFGLEAPEGAGKTVLVYSKVTPIVSTDDLVLDIISYHVFFSHTVIPLSICGKTLKALTGKLHIAGTL